MKMLNSMVAFLLAATGACAQADSATGMAAYSTAGRLPGEANRIENAGFLKPEYINNINVSAVRDFVKRFHEPDGARWYKLKDASLIVRFERPDTAFRVAYSSRGGWIYTFKTYQEKQMPRDVRAIVKSSYYDYTIIQVDEIDYIEAAATIYIVYIKDDTFCKKLRVCDGEIDVIESFYRK